MASSWYRNAHRQAWRAGVDLENDTLQVLLVDETYVFDPAHDFVADVVASEVAATNYARKTLNNQVLTEDAINNLVFFLGDDILYVALGGAVNSEIAAAIVFKFVTNDADSLLLVHSDVVEDWTTNGGNDLLEWPATGIGRVRLL